MRLNDDSSSISPTRRKLRAAPSVTKTSEAYAAKLETTKHPQEPQRAPADAPIIQKDNAFFAINRENIIAGIIFSEILAAPKARMRKRSFH